MEIRYYPIHSSLKNDYVINSSSSNLLTKINALLETEIVSSSLEDLYHGDLALILIESGGSEEEFLKIKSKLKEPYYLLTYGANNSLAASLEILSYIKRYGEVGEVLHGKEENIAKRIKSILGLNKVNDTRIYHRLGVIGAPSNWLISSNVNYEDVKEKFNIDLVNISINELIAVYTSLNVVLKDGRYNAEYDAQELTKAYRLYKAMKEIVKQYNLEGVTIRCFDLISSIKTTACLSLASLNEKGVVGCCEGDIPTFITQYVVKSELKQSSFQVNPCYIDSEENTVIFAHCTLPLDMCESYKFDTHYESNIGVGIKGELKEGDVTVVKVSPDLKYYFVSEGAIIKNLNRKDLCRTQIKVQLDENVDYFLKSPLGNHHVVIYGHKKEELSNYFNFLGLKSII